MELMESRKFVVGSNNYIKKKKFIEQSHLKRVPKFIQNNFTDIDSRKWLLCNLSNNY